ncbi:flavonol synthase/flavanone 3-hydroxylase [Kockovaella imperatae]|uniref:Flavonol synthase/flavanone 3-hydroxylase n=1 Tax=Kockovaella imperatae TaxID=4999 RepID=A0A1Y1UGP5_9TREE|nr:flavonol synthase/flavanone 3-hydroxylase [Kockovaella imperatae]ORX36674.1 flavonol synthase/flavanone 3-hydroxylase [Kockovaella imperatae]
MAYSERVSELDFLHNTASLHTFKMTKPTVEIPIIDFEGLEDGSPEIAADIGRKFYAACREVGFAYIKNHGIPERDIQGMFDYSRRFFALPYDIKMTAPHPPAGDHHRGYSGVGMEQVSQMVFDEDKLEAMRNGKGGDFKESYDMGSETATHNPNIWLEDDYLPGLRAYSVAFQATCRALQMRTLRALALGMPEVPEDFFERYHTEGDNQLRLLHYPSAPRDVFDSGEKGRIGAHTDFSTCTFLFQDDCGGLQVESPRSPGVFIAAPPIPGTIIFNIGDFLMRWSNDSLKSTLHRVVAPPPREDETGMTRERYSIPYFCGANKSLTIETLPGTWSESKPKEYAPITAGEYVNMRLNATYEAGVKKLKKEALVY